MNWWRRLFHHYEAYHAFGPPRLKYAGYFGLVAFTAFYFLRFTRPNPQPFDDVATRLAGMVLFTLLALKDRWPDRFKPYYFGYSYAVMLYGLPFFTILTALERGGGVPAMSNIFIVLCLLVLLTDWRNTLVMLAAGTAAAVLAYVATSSHPTVPMDLVAQLPAFAAIVIGGNIFKFSTEQIEAERKLRATQALAGSIAHEMRNPLGQIRHNLERMQQALPEPTTQAQPQTLSAPQVDALYRHVAESEVAVRRGLQVIAMTLDEVSARPVDAAGFSYLSAAEATHKAVREYAFESEADRAKVSVRRRAGLQLPRRRDGLPVRAVQPHQERAALPGAGPACPPHFQHRRQRGEGPRQRARNRAGRACEPVPALQLGRQVRRHRAGAGLLPPRDAGLRRGHRLRVDTG